MDVNNPNQPLNNLVNPLQNPVPEHPVKNQRGNLPIILGLLVLLLIVGGGAYYFGTQNGTANNKLETQNTSLSTVVTLPSPTTQANPTDISVNGNLKTHTNTTGRYSFQYPSDWTLEDYYQKYPNNQVRMKSHVIFENKAIVGDAPGNPVDHVWGTIQVGNTEYRQSTGGDGLTGGIPSETDFYNPNSKVWLKGNAGGGGPGYTYETPKEVTVAGKMAMMQQSHPTTTYEWVGPEQITIDYYVPLNNSLNEILYISFLYDKNNPNIDADLKDFNEMVSSLKLTQ